jgi:hypothetical protein
LIYETIKGMQESKVPIDLLTVCSHLDSRVKSSYVNSLLDGLHKNIKNNINIYIGYIKDTSKCRKVILHSNKLIDAAYTGDLAETLSVIGDFNVEEIREAKEKTITQLVKEWVSVTNGDFSVTECERNIKTVTRCDNATIRQILSRLAKAGDIERSTKKDGIYRRIENEAEVLDWKTADDKEYPIEFPFDLSKMTYIFPKSIVCIAGNFNAGKTAFCLETIRLNMDKLKVNYFTSEMGAHKLRQRLKKFENVEFPDGWKFNAVYRASNWADCLKDYPDDINIIDYLQIGADFWAVSDYIDQIFNRLNKGVAIICLQKTLGRDLGWGGDFSAERASLYLSIDPGKLKIVKAKEWRGTENPNGKFKRFKLVQGWKFLPDPDWITEDQEKTLKESETKRYKT